MGFYGNITDSSHTHFQFDKIFSSRTEMDRACLSGIDGIYAGRFVLVKYDTESRVFQGDILYGYFGSGENSSILYKDAACMQPYIFTTFTEVPSVEVNSANWSSYYIRIQQGDFYFKLANQEEFVSGQTYYTADASNGANYASLVSINTIVRLRDTSQNGALTSLFVRCTGTTSGQSATWEVVSSSQHYQNYFDNFALDQRTYGDDFNHRGYDATVWQKVYGEGNGRFIQVASLNTISPSFEFVTDPPSSKPLTAWIDPTSTAEVYRIHVPTHWGFRIKEAEQGEDEQGNTVYLLSDQVIRQRYHTYDSSNQEVSSFDRQINAEIYFNKDGLVKIQRHYDDDTSNEITITPTGESGKVYYDANGERITIDTYELSIHFPALGNLISDFYDLLYTEDRKLDTFWYDGNSIMIEDGDPTYNGKTRDLNTVAGLINVFQDRLGQNIVPVNMPLVSSTDVAALSTNFIYSYTAPDGTVTYYRVDNGYDFTLVPEYESVGTLSSDSYEVNKYYYLNNEEYTLATNNYETYNGAEFYRKNITYDSIGTLTEAQYEQNNYYILSNDEYIVANQTYNYYPSDQIFYKKNVSTKKYEEVSLIKYVQATYFYEDNVKNYILDRNEDVPSFYTRSYYLITSENEIQHQFDNAYAIDSFYTKENDIYILDHGNEEGRPDPEKTYYDLDAQQLVNNSARLYRPGIYYYYSGYENGNPIGPPMLDLNEEFSEGRVYWYIPKSDTLTYVYDAETGRVIVGYALDEANKQQVTLYYPQNADIEKIYAKIENNYVPLAQLQDSDLEYQWFLVNANVVESFFLPGVYYEKNNGNYILASSFGGSSYVYYSLINLTPLPFDFYQGGKYYYYNGNIYVIDPSITMTDDRIYYIGTPLYVYEDTSQRWAFGYEWPEQAVYVPASVDLATRRKVKKPFELTGINNGDSSLNGSLLQLSQLMEKDNLGTRSKDSITGLINLTNDALSAIKINLIPGKILYVDDFGQICASSISISQLEHLINNS